jgi:hypothetical protein
MLEISRRLVGIRTSAVGFGQDVIFGVELSTFKGVLDARF